MYVVYSRPNSWTDWAEIFCGHSGVAEGVIGKKNRTFFQIFFFHGQRRALQLAIDMVVLKNGNQKNVEIVSFLSV